MPVKSYKKKSIVAGSPALKEHEALMNDVLNDNEQQMIEPVPQQVVQQPVGVFSQHQYEPMKNVQTRVPLSVYEKLNRMKYFSGGKATSIGDIVLQAINEYVERHPVG